jgi:hypothetical protein
MLSEFTITPSQLIPIVVALALMILGAVIGIMGDRKKFKYQTKSTAKTRLVESIYRAVGAFPTLEMALRNNSLDEDQRGQLRDFASIINQANSTVKALGIESKSLPEVQELITKMASLGSRIHMHAKSKKARAPFPEERGGRHIQELPNMAEEGANLMTDAKKLADELRTEFQKKKYLIF